MTNRITPFDASRYTTIDLVGFPSKSDIIASFTKVICGGCGIGMPNLEEFSLQKHVYGVPGLTA